MSTSNEMLNDVLRNAGVSKTVYAWVMPETERTLDQVLDGGNRRDMLETALRDIFSKQGSAGHDPSILASALSRVLAQGRQPLRDMSREAWTQKQDSVHEDFFNTWLEWVSPVVDIDKEKFPYMYPVAGASEGIRTVIEDFGNRYKNQAKKPAIHVFTGEYEGYAAYAAASNIEIKVHNRKNWRQAIKEIGPNDHFYVSQPSAIDGNVWWDFRKFAASLNKAQPTAKIMLDLTYVGAVYKPYIINADMPNISKIFFSLSKPCGVYYYRIGGVLSRDPEASLFGNKWFKHLLSLRLGTQMMRNYDVTQLPLQYARVQDQAIAEARKNLGLNLKASDVFLLAVARPSKNPSDLERYLTRGSKGEEVVRVCLTPTMARIVDPSINATVSARAHESLPAIKPKVS